MVDEALQVGFERFYRVVLWGISILLCDSFLQNAVVDVPDVSIDCIYLYRPPPSTPCPSWSTTSVGFFSVDSDYASCSSSTVSSWGFTHLHDSEAWSRDILFATRHWLIGMEWDVSRVARKSSRRQEINWKCASIAILSFVDVEIGGLSAKLIWPPQKGYCSRTWISLLAVALLSSFYSLLSVLLHWR